MLRNRNNLFDGDQNRIISEAVTNNLTVRKVKKFNLADYIESCLMPQNSVIQQESFEDIFAGVNSGNCALFVDTLSVCFNIDVKGFKQRSISQPENEIVIKGSHEAFVENLRTNTSLIRRFANSENLIIENTKVGKITKTNCAICYMKNIANDDLIAEVKYRINNLDITIFANFLKRIRIVAAFFALLLPGLYVAITSFHNEIIPTELLYNILSSRQSVPFPIIFEILIMEISFEIIREAGLRVPSPIGPTLGIVGALVLGQAAVSAGIVSPILIIIVAITGISSFAIPDFTFSFHLRYFRFAFLLLGYIAGFIGIGIGIFIYISSMCDLKTFGVPYTAPYAPVINNKGNGYFLSPIWKREYRNTYLASKRQKRQDKISMKWKF